MTATHAQIFGRGTNADVVKAAVVERVTAVLHRHQFNHRFVGVRQHTSQLADRRTRELWPGVTRDALPLIGENLQTFLRL